MSVRIHWTIAALLTLPVSAHASLEGDDVRIYHGDGTSPYSATVQVDDAVVELPDAGPVLGMAGPVGRMDIDVQSTRIRVEFTVDADYGSPPTMATPLLSFDDLEPVCADGSVGTVTGAVPYTNIDPGRVITDHTGQQLASWDRSLVWVSAHRVQIAIFPGLTRVLEGDWIEVELGFSCAPPPTLTFVGSCPGPMDVEIGDVTPGGPVVAIRGRRGLGNAVIGVGPCAGVETSLAGLQLAAVVTDDDGDGIIVEQTTFPRRVCGMPVQVLDLTTCALSLVEWP